MFSGQLFAILAMFFRNRQADFFGILPRMCRGWQGWWGPQLHFRQRFSCLANTFLMRHHGELSSTEKRCPWNKYFAGNFQKKLSELFWISAEINRFWVVQSHSPLYKSGEQWQGSHSGLNPLCCPGTMILVFHFWSPVGTQIHYPSGSCSVWYFCYFCVSLLSNESGHSQQGNKLSTLKLRMPQISVQVWRCVGKKNIFKAAKKGSWKWNL